MASLSYRVEPCPEQHLFKVQLRVLANVGDGISTLRFSLPSWIPGSYKIRDFAKHIGRVELQQHGKQQAMTKLNKATWQAEISSGELEVNYQVYAFDESVRGSYLDNRRGFFNGPSLFICPEGMSDLPCQVEIIRPKSSCAVSWRVATAMPRAQTSTPATAYDFGTYTTANYDELLDHPVELGNFSVMTFQACGIAHDLIVTGSHQADLERICVDLTKICEQHLTFFGKPYPFERYVFLLQVVGSGYGGLEHRASTSLVCARHELPKLADRGEPVAAGYCNFLELCSHEYFHNWNIKRIKPNIFNPYQLTQETPTSLLWVFEGFTRYYEGLGLVRSGVISRELYLNRLAELMTTLQKTPGRLQQTLAESSFDAWIKLYQPDENAVNAMVSYYTKGGVVALLLDLQLRLSTAEKYSLDTVMQELWRRYSADGNGVAEGEVEQIVAELGGEQVAGQLQRWLHSLDELPIAPLLQEFGIAVRNRYLASTADRGGEIGVTTKAVATLGILGKVTAAGLEVTTVLHDSAAEQAGIAARDVLLAIDGLKFDQEWEQQVAAFMIGQTVTVVGFRRDELLVFTVKLQTTTPCGYVLTLEDGSTPSFMAGR